MRRYGCQSYGCHFVTLVLTICDNGYSGIVEVGPGRQHFADPTTVVDADVETLRTPPDVGVVLTSIADLCTKEVHAFCKITVATERREIVTVGVYRIGTIS